MSGALLLAIIRNERAAAGHLAVLHLRRESLAEAIVSARTSA
jgi:hypothetical protein